MTTTDRINHGKEQMAKFQFQQAKQTFEEALQKDSNSVDARVWLAKLSFVKNSPEDVEKQLNRALQIQPDHAEALALKGVSCVLQEKYSEAIPLLEEAKSKNPHLNMIYPNLARAYRKAELLENAEHAARTGVQQDPKNFHAYSELGAVLAKKKRLKEAVEQMRKAIEINPLFVKGYLVLGSLLAPANRGEQTIALYKQGLRVNPGAHILRAALCDLYSLKLDFHSAYREAAELAVRRNNYRDYLRLGTFAVALGLIEKAKKAFHKSLEINPKSWEGHFNLGELYKGEKLIQEAREQYELAIKNGENEFKPYIGLGLLLLKVDGKPDEAKNCFLRAMELAPQRPEPVINMAITCLTLNELDAAGRLAIAGLKLSPKGSPAHQEVEKLLRVIQNSE